MTDPQKIWQGVLGELELILSKANFTTWFKNTFIISIDEEKGQAVIGVPNAFTKSWMEEKYNTAIIKALFNVSGKTISSILYQIQTLKQSHHQSAMEEPAGAVSEPLNTTHKEQFHEAPNAHGLSRRYTFSNFIVGAGNQLAHGASCAVAEEPGVRYNPLFLYGDVGLGKTHLMHAIGIAALLRNPSSRVIYINFEKFTNDYVAAARKGGFDAFREHYRSADILLVDDVQFMIDKEKTQEEFFNTFEVLHHNEKQIVITSDRPPKALIELEDRMISRFEWGMIADIKMPDQETRRAILENKCKERGFSLEPEIIAYIAENIKNNIRELEGALNKTIAWYELNHKTPSLSSVREILLNVLADPARKSLSPRRIIEAVAEFYDVSLPDITGQCRKRELVLPRQIAMYLMRNELENSYPTIGQNIGGRDHTTVMYACQKIEDILEKEDRMRKDVEDIRQKLYR